jgi:hypothetical protein
MSKPQRGLRIPLNVTPRRIFLLQELMGLLVHSPTISFSSFFLGIFQTDKIVVLRSVQQQAAVAIYQHCLEFLKYGHGPERHLTGSTVASKSTAPTTYSGNSRYKDTIAERSSLDRGDSYPSRVPALAETRPNRQAPVLRACSI